MIKKSCGSILKTNLKCKKIGEPDAVPPDQYMIFLLIKAKKSLHQCKTIAWKVGILRMPPIPPVTMQAETLQAIERKEAAHPDRLRQKIERGLAAAGQEYRTAIADLSLEQQAAAVAPFIQEETIARTYNLVNVESVRVKFDTTYGKDELIDWLNAECVRLESEYADVHEALVQEAAPILSDIRALSEKVSPQIATVILGKIKKLEKKVSQKKKSGRRKSVRVGETDDGEDAISYEY